MSRTMTLSRTRTLLTTAAAALAFALALGASAAPALADEAAPLSALARMPVKEVTVFKDGHAFVMHSGKMPTDAAGNVLMDYLPTPVLGTFWPYSAEKNAKLTAVVASQRKVLVERTALTLRELIECNVGAKATITEFPSGREAASLTYPATIVGLPVRTSKEMETTNPPGSPEALPQKGNVVILKTADGLKVVSLDRIQDVTFRDEPKVKASEEEFRNLLTLKLDWAGGKKENAAEVGLFYLQKGLRWIPNYKISIDGKGSAVVKLQATLINELTDLEDATVNLVVGVPTFAFADQTDPISLAQTVATLARQASLSNMDNRLGNNWSNGLMSQVARQQDSYEPPARPAGGPDLGPEVASSGRSEDLFLYTVKHVTLKKGQRMVLPVHEMTLKYKDVYVLDVPFTPPQEMWRDMGGGQQAEMARLMARPKVMHKIRLTNGGDFPLTTAPALITSGEKVLAQGLMTYTAKGGQTDLAVTAAVDINVKKSDKETGRAPNAATWNKEQYSRVDLAGSIKLTNFRTEDVELEVTRYVLGNAGTADNDGKAEMVNILEDNDYAPPGGEPTWWRSYSWPYWWSHFNGIGKITWKFTLAAGKDVELKYTWNYYWR